MRVDPQVIAYFKSLAVKTGVPYHLINYVLKDYATLPMGLCMTRAGWRM